MRPVCVHASQATSVSLCACACLYSAQVFLNTCDATVFNLALLSSDAWGAFLGYKLFHQPLTWEYFTALSVVVVGVVLYNTAGNASFQRLGPVAALQPFSGYALPDETPVVDKPASGEITTASAA